MTLIESEQTKDIPITQILRGPFLFRYASYRKVEDANLNLRSEDYIVGKLESRKLVFALCDGVGTSFLGNVGSQILGEILVNWLSSVRLPENLEGQNNEADWLNSTKKFLHVELDSQVAMATEIVKSQPLKGSKTLVRNAEEDQRTDYGTQSNFACGIIWPKSVNLPKGLVVLFWLGNARIRIFDDKNKDLTSLLNWGVNPNELIEVWSSRDGVIGNIRAYLCDLSTISTIIAYSDGLEGAEDEVRPDLGVIDFNNLRKKAEAFKDDDISYLEISANELIPASFVDDISENLRENYLSTLKGQNLVKIPTAQVEKPGKSYVPIEKYERDTGKWKLAFIITLIGFVAIYVCDLVFLATNPQIINTVLSPSSPPPGVSTSYITMPPPTHRIVPFSPTTKNLSTPSATITKKLNQKLPTSSLTHIP